ncbi:hypothetical protein [Arthrobacter sp. UYCo732]|uniref:hypothetical protein n=1 Tax=Arthrobacter sp. UYCo732 TaxID=3156336 RepID=UPI0033977E3B
MSTEQAETHPIPGPLTFDAFTIQRIPQSASPLNLVYPSLELAEQATPRQGQIRQATFTLEPGEALAVSTRGGNTDTFRLFLGYARAYSVAQEARGYVVILTPRPWPLVAEAADGTEVVIGQRTGWKHDFINRRLVFTD